MGGFLYTQIIFSPVMEAKGSVVKSISLFVERRFPEKFNVWLAALPPASKNIYNKAILATEWYPMHDAVISPTETISDMFYDDRKKAAWESGFFSAEYSLNGVYKVFVLISKPSFLMSRTSKLLPSFYRPTEILLAYSAAKSMKVHITEFPEPHELLEYRIAGWMHKALEICGCQELDIRITQSMCRKDDVTEFSIDWK